MAQTSGQVAPHPSRLSVETTTSSIDDVEKARVSIDAADEVSTVRIPFSKKRTSRKLFCTVLIIANILFIGLVVGLAVGLSLRLRHPDTQADSSSSSSSSPPASAENVSHGGSGGSNRIY
ncbi:hypothetical protein TWF481_010890 [Arthrobotrys musiformis]|uniref:Uncharacterized protein n=1 Tax=Arthrobotrys musiformis TaxID=47236 RepID=A0AAV9VWW2_9PEZI